MSMGKQKLNYELKKIILILFMHRKILFLPSVNGWSHPPILHHLTPGVSEPEDSASILADLDRDISDAALKLQFTVFPFTFSPS